MTVYKTLINARQDSLETRFGRHSSAQDTQQSIYITDTRLDCIANPRPVPMYTETESG